MRKQRKCLKCGEHFDSEWVGNRLCDKCKAAVDKLAGTTTPRARDYSHNEAGVWVRPHHAPA